MIETLRLENFRGFEDHVLPLRDVSVLVGVNNAGKSTIVDALRYVSVVAESFRVRTARRFVGPPAWLSHPDALDGFAPSLRSVPTDAEQQTVFHRYRKPPAVITATFSSGAIVTVFVGPEGQLHGVARRPDGEPATRRTPGEVLGLDAVTVEPQIGPLLREERLLLRETVERGDGTHLAPQHFRNQLWHLNQHFDQFKQIAQETWGALAIRELVGDERDPDEPLKLLVTDEEFVGEVGLMGHGLQMWLQIVWFLARAPAAGTVVFDEPDVYMHPDLQRRLLDLIRSRFDQLLIATHSLEIIADVDPHSILVVDRRQTRSEFVTSLKGMQDVMDGLGSLQNVQMMRLMRSRAFYLVEGDDVKLLRILQNSALPEADPIDLIPHGDLNGRGGWGGGVPSRLPKKNAEGAKIRSYAILDRDAFPDEELAERYKEAREWGVQLRIWSRKEIENYLLVPEAISRLIADSARAGIGTPGPASVIKEIDAVVRSMRAAIERKIANKLLERDRGGGLKAVDRAEAIVTERWKARQDRWALASGKDVISALSRWSKQKFGVSFGAEQLARELLASEIDPEVVEVMAAIGAGRPLARPYAMPRQTSTANGT